MGTDSADSAYVLKKNNQFKLAKIQQHYDEDQEWKWKNSSLKEQKTKL